MIKRIKSIKSFGVFQNYKRSGNIQDFKEKNIIYGWNYSGKTTISRIFACLEKADINGDYPSCEFEIECSDGVNITQETLKMSNLKVRVFNSDFIRENLEWDGKNFHPILLLGEESIEAEAKIKKNKQLASTCLSRIAEKTREHDEIEKEVKSLKTSKAKDIREKLQLIEAFDRSHLEKIIARIGADCASQLITDTQLVNELIKNATANADDKLQLIAKIEADVTLKPLISETEELLKSVPAFSNTIAYLRDNPEVSIWVERGLELHSSKPTCEFCGGDINQNRVNELTSHFSKDFTDHKNKISLLIKKLESSKLNVIVKGDREFYASLRAELTKVRNRVSQSLLQYNQQISILINNLEDKHKDPFTSQSILQKVSDCSEDVVKALESYNGLIEQNNTIGIQFEKTKATSIQKLKNHYTAQLITESELFSKEKLQESLLRMKSRFFVLKQKYEDENVALEAQISKAQRGREELNNYIHSFLGREEISIEVTQEDGFDRFTLRRGSEKAVNLSEGEKAAIAFSFFLTKIKESGVLKDIIVYIDDPISSLDSNHIFQVNAMLKSYFFDKNEKGGTEIACKQLFISTHNFEFFNLLKELPSKKNETEYFYVKRTGSNTSTLLPLPKAMKNYSSEYHYLFGVLHKFHESTDKDDFEVLLSIPNAIRRFLELYTYSKYPTHSDVSVDQRADRLFGEEKSKRILKVLHYFSHLNNIERLAKNNDFICDVENSVNDLMVYLKDDKLHYEGLLSSVGKN